MNGLLDLDHNIFKLINQSWTSTAADWFFPIVTDLHKTLVFQVVLLPGLILVAIFRYRQMSILPLLGLIITLAINDFLCGKVIKPAFERPRPDFDPEIVIRAPHFGGFSFPSNHAANMFCFAVFLSFIFPKGRWFLFSFATMIAYSRVYCGIHYPTDVIGGALIGSLVGYLSFKICIRLRKRIKYV